MHGIVMKAMKDFVVEEYDDFVYLPQDGDEGVQAAIEVFEAENPNINVSWQVTPEAADYMQVLYTNFAAGVAPDTSFIISDDYESLRRDGILMDITDQIKSDPLLFRFSLVLTLR